MAISEGHGDWLHSEVALDWFGESHISRDELNTIVDIISVTVQSIYIQWYSFYQTTASKLKMVEEVLRTVKDKKKSIIKLKEYIVTLKKETTILC